MGGALSSPEREPPKYRKTRTGPPGRGVPQPASATTTMATTTRDCTTASANRGARLRCKAAGEGRQTPAIPQPNRAQDRRKKTPSQKTHRAEFRFSRHPRARKKRQHHHQVQYRIQAMAGGAGLTAARRRRRTAARKEAASVSGGDRGQQQHRRSGVLLTCVTKTARPGIREIRCISDTGWTSPDR